MAHTHYRLVLELQVPDAIAPDRVVRLLRDIPEPGTPIRCTVTRVPAEIDAAGPRSPADGALVLVRVPRRAEVWR